MASDGMERWGNCEWGDGSWGDPCGARTYARPATSVGGIPVERVDLRGPDVYHMPSWKTMSDPQRIKVLRGIVLEYGRDPRVAEVANRVLTQAGVPARDYKRQAAVLLDWVQRNVAYRNEPGERLQSPEYTLRQRFGDCDDLAILLASLYETVRLPWRMVLSGTHKRTRQTVRWVEGTPFPEGVDWAHIYVCVGRPTFRPTRWSFAEPSLKGAKLGWDVVAARQRGEKIPVPELGAFGEAEATPTATDTGLTVTTQSAPKDFFQQLKALKGELVAELHWRRLAATVIIGGITTVATTYLIEVMMQRMRKKKKG